MPGPVNSNGTSKVNIVICNNVRGPKNILFTGPGIHVNSFICNFVCCVLISKRSPSQYLNCIVSSATTGVKATSKPKDEKIATTTKASKAFNKPVKNESVTEVTTEMSSSTFINMSNSTFLQNNTSPTKARNDTQGNKDSLMNSSQTISFPLIETNDSFIGSEGSVEDTTAIISTPVTTDEVATQQNLAATSTTEDNETDAIDTFSSSAQNIPELKPENKNEGNQSLHSVPIQRLGQDEHDGFKVSEVLSNLGKSIINHHIESYIKNKTKQPKTKSKSRKLIWEHM